MLKFIRAKSKTWFMLIDKETDKPDLKFRVNYSPTPYNYDPTGNIPAPLLFLLP